MYYKAFYGNWNSKQGVRYICEGFDRKAIFLQAQGVADATGEVVYVRAEKGMRSWYKEVKPQGSR